MTKFYANADGSYWGGYDGPRAEDYVPADAVEVPSPAPSPHHRWQNDAWELDAASEEADKNTDATVKLNTPINKVLRDLYWDIEGRLRALGQDADLDDVRAATTKAEYTAVLKERVKALL